MSQLSSTACDRLPEINQFEGGRAYLGLWFQSMTTWPFCSVPTRAQCFVEGMWGVGSFLLYSKEGVRERGQGPIHPSRAWLSAQLSPTRCLILKVLPSPIALQARDQAFNTCFRGHLLNTLKITPWVQCHFCYTVLSKVVMNKTGTGVGEGRSVLGHVFEGEANS